MKNAIYLLTGGIALALFAAAPARAAMGGCEAVGGPVNFTTSFANDWTKEQNVAGTLIDLTSGTTSGGSYKMVCDCPANTGVNLYYSTTTPLANSGYSGFQKLNDSLDIKTVITDVPGVSALTVPTGVNSPVRGDGSFQASKGNSVCSGDPEDQRAGAFTVGSNVSITFRVTQSFLGRMEIPSTHIATLQSAWSSSSSYAKFVYKDIADIYLQGSITVPQSCKINEGDVIRVDLGQISASKFTTKDHMPDGYTPVKFDIVYDCGDASLYQKSDTLELVVQGDDVVSQYVLAARRRESDNVADVGIMMRQNVNIPMNGGSITLDKSAPGAVQLQAQPINLVGGVLQPGPFHGSVTLTATVR
ncbi:TPA: fimbrial protein [Klebsiella oxytoca]|uniref:fimbrial protein n=1 Tax=Klebsiella oxytoca TaxID=571 RepID=UPI001D2F5EFC|nr:fimbrial protein [Klebsiella oxytoca]CAE7050074.1 putative fimbrial-like protein YraK [Klebsiella oxytoca]CAH3598382.1 putative fimbrial-like protein YraK [Klebsiella oxytoca]HBN2767250.1 fimbrial protein [Klebsiella oxytoca]HDS6518611.1 fimbrial protein [Klebsiella oxytoca]HDT4988546.1 fimbrial protein [Klebsiella oxytoca]